jgi:hypothetical protein
MNQESLERANAFLAAVASRAGEGDLIDLSPAELGREIGVDEPLAAARAIRALLARRRLEAVDGRYRLLDRRPIEVGEREQVPRPRRIKRGRPRAGTTAEQSTSRRTTYSDIGRETVERLVELGREVGTIRGALRTAREEARDSQAARDDAERRASTLASRVKELEARAEMAESNLRTLLTAAKGATRDAPVGDTEMEAILGVLKGGGEPPSDTGESARSSELPEHDEAVPATGDSDRAF